MTCKPLFRNDDVSFDTNMKFFPAFCNIFHKNGYRQLHAVTLRGLCNYAHTLEGKSCVYEGYPTLSQLDNMTIRKLSEPYRFEDNAELVAYLAASEDEIALHGFYHTNYQAMDYEKQLVEMRRGLELLQAIFPEKNIRFFVPPFNKINRFTRKAANELNLRVLGDEGVHLELELDSLIPEPGIWHRYHHHRFYPDSTYTYGNLSLPALDKALSAHKNADCNTPLPMPSFDYEGDIRLLERLIAEHDATCWFAETAKNRLDRRELNRAMGWIYSHIEPDAPIFEMGCGSGNNLVWLATRGYGNLGGSDREEKALAVSRGMAQSLGMSWNLLEGDILSPDHIPHNLALIMAVNSSIYLKDFRLEKFLNTCKEHLRENGCILMDIVDISFNSHSCNQWKSTQWKLPEQERSLPSEYQAPRLSSNEVKAIARKSGMKVVAALASFQVVPRYIYVFARENAEIIARRPLPILSMPEEMVHPTMDLIAQSGLFDWAWYRREYVRGPEVMDPLEHYVRFGAYKGYWPNPDFDSNLWRRKNMDLCDPTNPLAHALSSEKQFNTGTVYA